MSSLGTLGNLVGAFRPPEKTGGSKVACSCPACTGLECLERPRFFAGQLLSEVDFNSEIDYMLAKQRLHNRYLHGVGTVCGLEVVCCDCPGQVIIQPGYAIDPCGNDIIVCQQQQFDVIEAIQACCDARKRRSKTGCDPYQPASDPGCSGVVQNWCITIQYQETPTQPITPLRGQKKTCSCNSCSGACGCGCCCGNGSSTQSNGCSGTTSSNGSSSTSTSTPVSCEPTRILESYQLGVVEDPETCNKFSTLFQNTLLYNLVQCVLPVFEILDKNANVNNVVTASLAGTLPTSQILNSDAFAACCQLRQLTVDLFSNNEVAVKCDPLKNLSTCPQPPQTDPGGVTGSGSDPAYLGLVQTAVLNIWNTLVSYMAECACYQLLPPCPSDPGDDRLILACVTIQNGIITKICNFGCRKFAGAFPSFFYWLSLIPIIPLLKILITDLCCGVARNTIGGSDFARSNIDRSNFSSASAAVPVATVQRRFTEGNFALPKMIFDRIGDLTQKFSLQGLLSAVPAGGLNLSTIRGMSVENAQKSLDSFGITYNVQQVNSRAEIPLSTALSSPVDALLPFVTSGDHVVLYQTGGNVVEIQRANVAQTQTVLDLQKQVATMKADIEVLKKANPPQKP